MAVTNYASWVALNEAPSQLLAITEGTITIASGRHYSLWVAGGGSLGVAPTTAVVPGPTTPGAIYQQFGGLQNSPTEHFLGRVRLSGGTRNGFYVGDRLSHQGGLDATLITEQTTNLPTAALTRYTSGVGVMIGLEIYTLIGATGTTVTARYTNQAGTGTRTTKAAVFGGTGFREVNRLIILPLQDSDTGVRSVEGVTVLATTGTAGDFGVTLFKPLLPVYMPLQFDELVQDNLLNGLGIIPLVEDGACLQWFCMGTQTPAGPLFGLVNMIEP